MKNALLFLLFCLLPLEVFGQQEASSGQTALVFTHVTVIDATGAPAKTDMTVVVKGALIEALGKTGKLTIPQNAQVVDATGKFIIPGLWDMHIHPYADKNYLALFIANGVTGTRVMLGLPRHHQWRKEISAGELIGPRMVISSPQVGDSPDDFPAGNNEDEGRQVVRKVKNEGADFVKVMHWIPRDAYFAIADEANKLRIPFAGHLPYLVSAAEASDAGQQSIEHAYHILMACSSEGEEELRKRARPEKTLEAERADNKLLAGITHSEKKAAELFARFVKNSTWVCPTIMVYHDFAFRIRDMEDITNDPRLKYMIPHARDRWENNLFLALVLGEGRDDFRKICEKDLAIVGAMRDAGVGLLAGTDHIQPGFGLQDELALFVQAGLSPMEALQTATYNAAKCLGLLDSIGTIEQGKIADLVLLDADPLQDIGNTRRIAAVVVGGKVYDKTALQKMLIQVEARSTMQHLRQAAADSEIERVKLLISKGVDVNVKNDEGLTLLHCAARDGHKEIVELLLAHGANVNVGDADYNRIAAEFAMRSNHTEIVQLLVSKGADISPLHFALYMKDEARARSLIEGGADVNRRTPYGTTPLTRAVDTGFKDIVELLIAKGANVNAKNNFDWTPLHSAAYGNKDIVELLITEGANVNARNGANRTPLWYAKNEGNAEIVELLRRNGAKE